MRHGVSTGARVARRSGYKHTIVVSHREGLFNDVVVRVAAATDGEVDNIYAIENGLLNGRNRVTAVAAGGGGYGTTNLVGNDLGARSHTRDEAHVVAQNVHIYVAVTGNGAGGVGTMTIIVASGQELISHEGAVGFEGSHKAVSANDFVVTIKADAQIVAVGLHAAQITGVGLSRFVVGIAIGVWIREGGFSGQIPESKIPTITPSPAFSWPPRAFQTVGAPIHCGPTSVFSSNS